jgi:hypothetical protein
MNCPGLTSPRLPALLLPLLLAACPGKDGVLTEHTSGGTTTGSETTTTTTGESDTSTGDPTTGEPACPCIVDDPDPWRDPSLPTCADPICPKAAAIYQVECDTDCNDDIDAEAVDCALVALRDRTPGLLTWSLDFLDSEAQRYKGYMWIRGDGSAVWRMWEEYDLVFTVWAAQVVELPTSEAYAQCLADPDPRHRFDCLQQSLSGPDNLVCDEGWMAEGI